MAESTAESGVCKIGTIERRDKALGCDGFCGDQFHIRCTHSDKICKRIVNINQFNECFFGGCQIKIKV